MLSDLGPVPGAQVADWPFGYDELGEIEVARENVSFRLPREVTTTA